MTRSLLFASVFALVLCAAPAELFAQQNRSQSQQKQQQNTPYGSYVPNLYGQDKEEEKPSTWQYDNKYRKKFETPGKDTNPLPTGTQQMYFIRKQDIKSNEAVLRMLTPISIDGCANIVPPAVTMRKGGNMLIFSIEDGAVTLDKKAQYAHFQCNNASHVAFADITLNRDELLRDGIKSMSFQAANGAMDVYDVKVTPDRITLVVRGAATAFKPFLGATKSDPLTYDFYPDNLIILHAPSAPAGQDVSGEITALAQRKGLSESAVLKNAPGLYFIDQAGTLAGSLDFGANAFVGTISVPETYQGPDGSYEQAKAVDVYARRPGLLD
ncbi:MAG: hypothetical protein WBK55_01185 [Alphaproteobacteria bacterium]